MKKILIVSLAGVGDTLCATPLIEELRRAYPSSQIDVLVMWRASQQILENNPHLTQVIHYPFIRNGYLQSFLFCLSLRKKRYDLIINSYPQSQSRYRIISWLIGGVLRISHTYDHSSLLDRFLTHKSIHHDYTKHCIENNLDLFPLFGLPRTSKRVPYKVYLRQSHHHYAENLLHEHRLTKKKLFGIHLGSGTTKNLILKRWPLEYYERFIKMILARHPFLHVLLFAGPEEIQENKELLKRLNDPRVVMVQPQHILDTAAVLEHCTYFLSVDGVLMHLAASVDVPHQIVLRSAAYSGAVTPYRKKFIEIGVPLPQGVYYRFDAHGIHGSAASIRRYMRSITPEQVYGAVRSLFSR